MFPDPDGFLIQLNEPVVAPDFAPEPGKPVKDITLSSFTYIVSNADKMAPIFAALGLEQEKAAPFNGGLDLRMMGFTGSGMRRATARVPVPEGSTPFRIDVIDMKGVPASKGRGAPQDPGATVLRFLVRDTEEAVRALGAVGLKVASARGEIVTLPGAGTNRPRAAILSGPDSLFIQVVK